jgi:hypothetical protein
VQAEYVIGLLLAMVAGRYLLPACLSLLGGLAEALLNKKAMFPGSQAGGWILILTTGESVPLYVAVLALFQQILGGWLLTVACILAALYTSLGMLTGQRMLSLKSGDAQREILYGRVWAEYILRVFLGVGILVVLFFWDMQNNGGLMKYVQTKVLTTEVLATAAIDLVAKKIVTAVAGTDLVLSAFVQAEHWQVNGSQEDRQVHDDQVRTLAKFLWSASPGPGGAVVPTDAGAAGDGSGDFTA